MNLNAQVLDKTKFLLKPESYYAEGVDNLLDRIKTFINTNECEELTLDLRGQNLIYATQIGILASSYHFIKYIDGKVNIIVDSEEARNSIELLNLSNISIMTSCTEEICEIA